MRQLGVALQAFEARRGHYPGWLQQSYRYPRVRGSWVHAILPDIEERYLDEQRELLVGAQSRPETVIFRIDLLVCPDDRLAHSPESRKEWALSYAANAGIPDRDYPGSISGVSLSISRYPDSRANGVFHDVHPIMGRAVLARPWLRVTNQYLARHDGTSKTILISENVDSTSWEAAQDEHANCIVWDAEKEDRAVLGRFGTRLRSGGTAWDAERPYHINEKKGERPLGKGPVLPISLGGDRYQTNPMEELHKDIRFSRPSSFHQGGGVNMIFCDASGRFVSEQIPYAVYVQLMTPHGDAAVIDAEHDIPAPDEYRQPLPKDF